MKQQLVDDVAARKFLLGELTPEEQGDVEEQGFLDRDTFALIQAAEDDLIDEFLSGDLSPNEKQRFEKHFLSTPGRYGDVKVAKALQKYISQNATPSLAYGKVASETPGNSFLLNWLNTRSSTARLFLVAAVLLIGVAGVWLVARMLRQQQNGPPIQAHQDNVRSPAEPRNKPTQSPVESANSQGSDSNQPKPRGLPRQPAAPTYLFVLIPGGPARSEDSTTKVRLPQANGVALFELPLIGKKSYRSYRATLERDGTVVRTLSNLKAGVLSSGRGIEIRVPAILFESEQNYRILLSGISSDGTLHEISAYYFQVTN